MSDADRKSIPGLLLRRETPADHRAVEEMVRDAFWDLNVPGCDEHVLVHVMRGHPDFLPQLDFVAEWEGRLAGCILHTRGTLRDAAGGHLPVATFGPVCVRPDLQQRGIGRALIEHSRQQAAAEGFPALVIYGDPANYVTHGFRNGRDFQVRDPRGLHPYGLLVMELVPGALAAATRERGLPDHSCWTFCASPVYELDPSTITAVDATFPPRVRSTRPSQVLFSIQIRAVLEP